MRAVAAAVAVVAAIGCDDSSSSNVTVDASPDSFVVNNPPLECPMTDPRVECTEPLSSLAGTWKFSPSTTMTITLTAYGNQMLVATTNGTTDQMMHLFSGDWTVEPTGAWRCSRSGSARTLSSICKQASGEIRISGDTRVPGFHTSYETTEYFSGVLEP